MERVLAWGVGVTLWMEAMGEEVRYQLDLPACCRRSIVRGGVRREIDEFECPVCGDMWKVVLPVEPETCAFRDRERLGAA